MKARDKKLRSQMATQLAQARAALGRISIKQAAESLNVAEATLSRAECADRRVSTRMLTSLMVQYERRGVEFRRDGWVRLNPDNLKKEPPNDN